MITDELQQQIRADHRAAYTAEAAAELRTLVNGGDPWRVIEAVSKLNPAVSKFDLFDLIGTRANAAALGLSTTCAAHVTPEAVSWLWRGRIALGKLTLFAGDPGLGKSMLTGAMAAHVTTGRAWPVDRSACPQGSVIMASAEDDLADTIRPRLDAAGADPHLVHVLNMVTEIDDNGDTFQRAFSIEKDIPRLEAVIREHSDCKLITVDPISAYLGKVDSHNNAEIRAVLAPLADMAQKYSVAVVGITHFNKSSAGALYRAMGSLAFVAAARAAYAVTKCKDDPDRRLFLPLKNNLGDDKTGFAYTIQTGDNGAPYVAWEPEQVTVTADEAMAPGTDEEAPALREAMDWLIEELRHGMVKVKDLQKVARDAGLSWRTVRRAKDRIGVKSEKRTFDGQWQWVLPINPDALNEKPF